MASYNFFQKNLSAVIHLPTWMLILGYPLYWLELYVFNAHDGITSPWAWVLWGIIAGVIVHRQFSSLCSGMRELEKCFRGFSRADQCFIGLASGIALFIFVCALLAWMQPLHLRQERDLLIYHAALPRQHLLHGTFQFIRWAADDLYLMPVAFSLAPYWFVTEFPNKIPQCIFFVGFFLLVLKLCAYFCRQEDSKSRTLKWLTVAFLVLGSHGIGIQMGTGMLDITVCYLLLAAVDSFLCGRIFLFCVEFVFYLWAKPFIPLQSIVIIIGLLIVQQILSVSGVKATSWNFSGNIDFPDVFMRSWKKAVVLIILLSIFIAGPFLVRSLYYSGTPLFPFGFGKFMVNDTIDQNSRNWKSLEKLAAFATSDVKDQYGSGRGIGEFVQHFWLIAVPENRVNNCFDYPAGLPHLLVIFPFTYMFINSIKKRIFSIVPWFIVVYWMVWWIGSQQMRFLYIPMVLMFLVVTLELKSISRIFLSCMLIALILNALSVFRAHQMGFGKSGEDILRKKDADLVAMSREYIEQNRRDDVILEYGDVAFARFPVMVVKPKFPYILEL